MGFFTNDLDKCVAQEADVGIYRWGSKWRNLTTVGITFYQVAIKELSRKSKEQFLPCNLMREPQNKHSARAIALVCQGRIIGHVPNDDLDFWHQIFEQYNDPRVCLAGRVKFRGQGSNTFFVDAEIRIP